MIRINITLTPLQKQQLLRIKNVVGTFVQVRTLLEARVDSCAESSNSEEQAIHVLNELDEIIKPVLFTFIMAREELGGWESNHLSCSIDVPPKTSIPMFYWASLGRTIDAITAELREHGSAKACQFLAEVKGPLNSLFTAVQSSLWEIRDPWVKAIPSEMWLEFTDRQRWKVLRSIEASVAKSQDTGQLILELQRRFKAGTL